MLFYCDVFPGIKDYYFQVIQCSLYKKNKINSGTITTCNTTLMKTTTYKTMWMAVVDITIWVLKQLLTSKTMWMFSLPWIPFFSNCCYSLTVVVDIILCLLKQ